MASWSRKYASVAMVAVSIGASACTRDEPAPQKRSVAAPSNVSKEVSTEDSSARSETPKRQRSAAARDYIAPLLNPRLGRMTHEEAKRELAPSMALTVVEPMPGSLQLIHQSGGARVQLDYLPDAAGKWAFADAVVEVLAESPEQAKRSYADLADYLRGKLGGPQWEKSEQHYPSSGYRLGEEYAVSLGAIAVPGEPSQIAFSIENKAR